MKFSEFALPAEGDSSAGRALSPAPSALKPACERKWNDKSDWLRMHANLRQRMKRVLTWSGVAMGGEQEHGGQHHQGDGHQ